MADWNTRLAVSFTDDQGKTTEITPIDTFNPTFNIKATPIPSLESAGAVGVIFEPPAVTFSMSVKAMGDAAALLTAIALRGQHFDISLQEAEGGNDWSFKSIVLEDCVITSAQPSNVSLTGIPAATFQGMSLGVNAAPKNGEPVKFP